MTYIGLLLVTKYFYNITKHIFIDFETMLNLNLNYKYLKNDIRQHKSPHIIPSYITLSNIIVVCFVQTGQSDFPSVSHD